MPFDFSTARFNMVEGQIRPNKVTNPILLDRLEDLPREQFVRADQQGFAYSEGEVEAAPGRFLLAPMVMARMIEALEIESHMTVLDVAPATGYSTALLAALARAVVGLEADAGLATHAAQICQRLELRNVQFTHGPLSMGAKQLAPYDRVFVNGAMAEMPRTLLNQLGEEGRLIAIIKPREDIMGEVTLFTKYHGNINSRPLFEAAASYLPGFAPHEEFVL